MRITKLSNTFINALNKIHKGFSFTGIEWSAKNVVTRIFNILTVVINEIEGVLGVMLKFMFSKMI